MDDNEVLASVTVSSKSIRSIGDVTHVDVVSIHFVTDMGLTELRLVEVLKSNNKILETFGIGHHWFGVVNS